MEDADLAAAVWELAHLQLLDAEGRALAYLDELAMHGDDRARQLMEIVDAARDALLTPTPQPLRLVRPPRAARE